MGRPDQGVDRHTRPDREACPTWDLVERLAKHAADIPEAKSQLDQIDAIRSQRLLLEAADPANTIRQGLAGLLRDAVQKGHAAHDKAFVEANAALAANSVWASCSQPTRTASRPLSG